MQWKSVLSFSLRPNYYNYWLLADTFVELAGGGNDHNMQWFAAVICMLIESVKRPTVQITAPPTTSVRQVCILSAIYHITRHGR